MNSTVRTQTLTVDPQSPAEKTLQTAAAVLQAGGLVAFPTETVYGLGANALDADAIDRIYVAKRRPANDPIIAHIAHIDQLATLADSVPEAAYQLAEVFWPGPLTLVLRRAAQVPDNIAAGLDTIAIRMPSNIIAQALIQTARLPIAAPSANTFTRPSATTAQHVLADLGGRVDLVLDGGPTTIGLESTVLSLTGEKPTILRPGGVVRADLRRVVPDVQVQAHYQDETQPAISPGQMLKHYSPSVPLQLYRGPLYSVLVAMRQAAERHTAQGQQVGLLLADEDTFHLQSVGLIKSLGRRDDLRHISHNLFAAMRELDNAGVDLILARDFGRKGLGVALWDRLLRAAEGNVIDI